MHLREQWSTWHLAVLAFALGGCAVPGAVERPRPTAQTEFHLPREHVPPLGQCRIWYVELPPEWQPPAMACARAHDLAAKHGGRVVKAISKASYQNGRTMSMDYGPGNFEGIAPEQLPPPGYCRAWHDRVQADRQPPAMTCEKAKQLVRERGGRLLYMPGPEQK
jgi:hypothetical protein